MRNGANIDHGRRRFFQQLGMLLALSVVWSACKNAAKRIVARFFGANASLGHRLLLQDFPPVSQEERVKILVIGGGISGLSACRSLARSGEHDFLLLDLEPHLGGNSASGQNAHTPYPLGAHYLPLPNTHDTDLIDFLREEGIVTGFDASGEPVFSETALVSSPQARLYLRNFWQEGLIPQRGVSAENQAEIQVFFQKMTEFQQLRGADGKYVFDIPIRQGSNDTRWQFLDRMSMSDWLKQASFQAAELLEHVQYCCLDDFGVGIERVSAWAGIHYFAARKNRQDNVLTWPEGNGFLVKCLQKHAQNRVRTQHLAYEIKADPQHILVKTYDAAQNRSVLFRAERVILATPQFVNQRLFPARQLDIARFHYVPWLVATLVLRELPRTAGMPLCWDNVIFQGQGLGYINVQHQSVAQHLPKQVITYYCAFDGPDVATLRRELYRKDEAHWQRFVLDDLRRAHPDIESWLESMDIQRWGHGMIAPVPGFLFGQDLARARQSWDARIFLAHSDLSGMSLFEEAFHQGISAAQRCLKSWADAK